MGVQEIAHRLSHAIQSQWERRGFGLARSCEPQDISGRLWLAELPRNFDAFLYCKAADRVLAGFFDIFALKDAALGFPPDWNRDPKTGTLAPMEFGKTLNYRDERIVGDIKYLWEPNRHAELVTLAQAWHLTKDEKYAEGCSTLLVSWFEQCPYPLGVNWTSSLEHGVRLMNWAVAWGLLGGWLDTRQSVNDQFKRQWLSSIQQHCHFIAGHFSRHSSANNHYLGELMGLFVASLTWPCWPESKRWQAQARAEFEFEALRQNAPDGVNREQAIWYHHEVADMMLLVGLFGRANGVEFSQDYWARLEKLLDFIAALMDVRGNMPMIGDADDARIVRFDPWSGRSVFRSLLATGAVLFRRADFKAKAKDFDDKSRWLLGDGSQSIFEALPAEDAQAPCRAFPKGGYWILGDGLGTPHEVRIVADAGPLGYLSIAAHGHADTLSFTLSAAGRDLLIDPGTYSYHTQKVWRDYFRGTSAHNTARVDRLDQSVIGGNFLWTRHAAARCLEWAPGDEMDRWVGEHDGYRRLADPVTHQRELMLDKEAKYLEVTDRLTCKGRHRVEIFWHFAEDCEVSLKLETLYAVKDDVQLTMTIPPGMSAKLVSGQMDPPIGWVSRAFDVKTPCTSLVMECEVNGDWQTCTRIEIVMLKNQGQS